VQELNEHSYSKFHCCAEWHLAKLKSYAAVVIYGHGLRLSKNSGIYSASADEIAHFFDLHENGFYGAVKKLVKAGFFVLIKSGKTAFESSEYKVLTHTEWAVANPGLCTEKEDFGWESIKLGQQMFAMSGRKIKVKSFQVRNLLNTGLSEDLIIAAWGTFLAANAHQPKSWRKSAGYYFWEQFRMGHPLIAQPGTKQHAAFLN
jgi:hypothetical protein